MVKPTYKIGDKVFAKVKGYPPWPARIEGDTGKKKYNVLFYGTKETGAIKTEEICYYLKNKANYVSKYVKRAGYEDAVNEIEAAIKKDGGDGNENASADESVVNDIDTSDASNMSVSSCVSEKRAPKRKVASLPSQGEAVGSRRSRRKSVSVDGKDQKNEAEEPPLKKSRKYRNSNESDTTKEDEEKHDDKDAEGTERIKNDSVEKIDEDVETIETSEEENKEVKKDPAKTEKPKAENEVKKNVMKEEKETDTEKPKEPEFVSIANNEDDSLQPEEDPVSDDKIKVDEKVAVNVEIVTEQLLKNVILYAEHVRKHIELYKDKPIEPRNDSENQVFPANLPSGVVCGLKLHQDWPLEHSDEHERALYDEKIAKRLLEIRDKIVSGEKGLSDFTEIEIIPDIQMTADDITELSYTRDIDSKKIRLDKVVREANLLTWDSKIKNCLGLDKAQPDAALEALKEFSEIGVDLDEIMFKKHPHVLDTVRRLRKYVGNVKEWDMPEPELDVFYQKAEQIRTEAEQVYNKIKKIVYVPDSSKSYWDGFLDVVSEFRKKCKHLSEAQVSVLSAEPNSRQTFFDELDEVAEREVATPKVSKKSEPVLKETSVQGWAEKK